MVRRRDYRAMIALAILVFSVPSCSHETPTAPTGSDRRALPQSSTIPSAEPLGARPGAVTFLEPDAISSIRHLPEMDILDEGYRAGGTPGVDGDMYSTYFRTTATNREFRRGFAEFAIPRFTDVFSARVVLRETRATMSRPVPQDRHELSYYTDVDLFVNTGDFDRPTLPLATFETDANLEDGTFDFDVSRLVSDLRGARLGLRVKLETDPFEASFVPLGSAFARNSTPSGIRIEVTTTSVEANDRILEIVRGMHLPPDLEADLLTPLQQVADLLHDGDPGNDGAVCGKLDEFLAVVASEFPIRAADPAEPGRLTALQAWDLTELAQNLQTSLGCSGAAPHRRRAGHFPAGGARS